MAKPLIEYVYRQAATYGIRRVLNILADMLDEEHTSAALEWTLSSAVECSSEDSVHVLLANTLYNNLDRKK